MIESSTVNAIERSTVNVIKRTSQCDRKNKSMRPKDQQSINVSERTINI